MDVKTDDRNVEAILNPEHHVEGYDIKQIFEDEVSNIDKSFKVDKDKFLRDALGEDSFIKMTEEFGQAPQPRKESMKSQKPDNRQE